MSKQQIKKASSHKKNHGNANAVKTRAHLSGSSAARATERRADPRLPAVGTVIKKVDRHGNVRCKCRVEKQGIRYNGTVYPSLSGAAMAAATDLGLESPTQNGYVFWALS